MLAYIEEAREEYVPARDIPTGLPQPVLQWPDAKRSMLDVLRKEAPAAATADDFINIIKGSDCAMVRAAVQEVVGSSDAVARLECVVKELAAVVCPRYVASRDSAGSRGPTRFHVCNHFLGSPSEWSTLCGWKRVASSRKCLQAAALPAHTIVCKRCAKLAADLEHKDSQRALEDVPQV